MQVLRLKMPWIRRRSETEVMPMTQIPYSQARALCRLRPKRKSLKTSLSLKISLRLESRTLRLEGGLRPGTLSGDEIAGLSEHAVC